MKVRTELVWVFLCAGFGCGTSSTPSTSGDSGADATKCVGELTNYACDVTKFSGADLRCRSWAGRPPGDGGLSCKASFDWDTNIGGGAGCRYVWKSASPPDPCTLPSQGNLTGTEWLRPDCDGGCPP